MFSRVKSLFDSGQLFVEDEFLTSRGLSFDEFNEIFPKDDYSSFDYVEKSKTGTVKISQLDFIFFDYHELFSNVICKLPVSEEVLILSDQKDFIALGETVNFFNGWLEFFEELSDHAYPKRSEDYSKTFIFIDKGGKNNSSLISLDLGELSSSRLKNLIKNITSPILLLESFFTARCTST